MVSRVVPRARVIAVLLLWFVVCGCVTTPPQLPYGGYNASDPRWSEAPRHNIPGSDNLGQAFVDAALQCDSGVVTGRVRIRGTVETRRINRSLSIGLDVATGRLRLGSVDAMTPVDLVTSNSYDANGQDEGTLVLPARRWVVRSRSRELVELLLGVPLSALDLQNVLTGCPATRGGNLSFELFDSHTVKMVLGDERPVEVFMRRRSMTSPWTVFSITNRVPGRPIRWRADPGRRSGGVLESVRLTSLEWNGVAGRLFDLTFSLDRIQTPATAPDMFTLPIDASANDLPADAVRLNISVPLLAD